MACPKCGSSQFVTASAIMMEFRLDSEPLTAGKTEDLGIETIETEVDVVVQYCLDCTHTMAWIESPRNNQKGTPMPDELFPVVRMPPNKSTPVVIVTPERLAELEAEIVRLREERATAWFEVSRIRGALRNIIPESKCDGVDLPGVVGTEVERLRTACGSALFAIEALESGKLTDRAAHYTMVGSTCAMLRAIVEQKGDENERNHISR